MPDEAEALRAIAASLAQEAQPRATLAAVDEGFKLIIGHKLFTALLFDRHGRYADRIYSSQPGAYSTSSGKPIDNTPAMRIVRDTAQPYLAKSLQDVIRDFPDHEAIAALGCGSVLNLPVRWRRRVLGQLNLLHAAGHFKEEHVAFAETVAQLCVPAFLAAGDRQISDLQQA